MDRWLKGTFMELSALQNKLEMVVADAKKIRVSRHLALVAHFVFPTPCGGGSNRKAKCQVFENSIA
jgi:hypothetical protein